MMHDLLRELAIHQSKEESFEKRKRLNIDLKGDDRPNWWIGSNQQGMISRMHSFVTGMLVKRKQLKVAARILSISTEKIGFCQWRGAQELVARGAELCRCGFGHWLWRAAQAWLRKAQVEQYKFDVSFASAARLNRREKVKGKSVFSRVLHHHKG
ncbi:disease resistance protein [Trifolium medium]|uniref:Disease resistance protein n=1 Tax=Trifolium medium TaxID=97028 RepID=A0A392NWL8_9FABA|nr:disease resistance protein [Trifolium medium]